MSKNNPYQRFFCWHSEIDDTPCGGLLQFKGGASVNQDRTHLAFMYFCRKCTKKCEIFVSKEYYEFHMEWDKKVEMSQV